MWKSFCHLDRKNSIETYLWTCNLLLGQFISYKSVNQFWLNLPYLNGKKFFQIKCQKNFTFANGYFLSFRILSWYKKCLLLATIGKHYKQLARDCILEKKKNFLPYKENACQESTYCIKTLLFFIKDYSKKV